VRVEPWERPASALLLLLLVVCDDRRRRRAGDVRWARGERGEFEPVAWRASRLRKEGRGEVGPRLPESFSRGGLRTRGGRAEDEEVLPLDNVASDIAVCTHKKIKGEHMTSLARKKLQCKAGLIN